MHVAGMVPFLSQSQSNNGQMSKSQFSGGTGKRKLFSGGCSADHTHYFEVKCMWRRIGVGYQKGFEPSLWDNM
jgi:hypothetical protein